MGWERRTAGTTRRFRGGIAGTALLGTALAAVLAAPLLSSAQNVPLPRPKPDLSAPEPAAPVEPAPPEPVVAAEPAPEAQPAVPPATSSAPAPSLADRARSLFSQINTGALPLRSALTQFENGNVRAAWAAADTIPDVASANLAKWLIATSGRREVPSSLIREAMADLPHWPGQSTLRIRFEQALIREEPDGATAIAELGPSRPVMEPSTLLFVRSLVAAGREAEAHEIIRPYWRENTFSEEMETVLLAEFPTVLTAEDHRARMDMLLFRRQETAALRIAELLGPDYVAIAEAFDALGGDGATAELNAVPEAARTDPAYLYARALNFEEIGRPGDAAAVLRTAPSDPAALINPDAWSRVRFDVARRLVARGDYRAGYDVISAHSADGSVAKGDAEFLAGWIALRYLDDPAAARRHFSALEAIATLPQSIARAAYWLGRTSEAEGDSAGAAEHFQTAAAQPSVYYGQLATAELGLETLALPATAEPDEAARQRFANLEFVRVIDRLIDLGRTDELDLFFRHAGSLISDPAELALLVAKAEGLGKVQLAVQIAILAGNRGVAVGHLPFPTSGIPELADPPDVELAALYAIARQESVFNTAATSSANAQGLMRLLPGTARQIAASLGLPYSDDRLISDPALNATLGGTYLSRLLADYRGSYALALVAYNAGPGRVDDWIAAYGDPRSDRVDPVDWVERIPFDETRNYVQRVLQNLQVYRLAFGDPELKIEADLRGR